MANSNRFGPGWVSILVLLAVAWLALPGSGRAQQRPQPSPDKGREIAERFCKGCHLIEDRADAPLPAGVPTFRGIANRPGQTGQHIMNVLIKPHAPMPDIHLSNEELLNIVAYLETLRIDKSIPPLLETAPQAPKLQYPAPS